MHARLPNDSTVGTNAIVFQFCVAVEACFTMLAGQRVLIEKMGDVSVEVSPGSNNAAPANVADETRQIEVKAYSDRLTDGHLNFWKTLRNWLREEFDHARFAHLVLLTTQEFGDSAVIANWNSMNADQRVDYIARECAARSKSEKASELDKIKEFIESLGDKRRIYEVLQKFIIAAEHPSLIEAVQRIKQRYLKGILESKKDECIQALIGYVARPEAPKSDTWEISYDEFTKRYSDLVSQLRKGTVLFPRPSVVPVRSAEMDDSGNGEKKLYIKKIEAIAYHEVIPDAIAEFTFSSKCILSELIGCEITQPQIDAYMGDVIQQFEALYRMHSRKAVAKTADSRDFYDSAVTDSVVPLAGFNDTPRTFRNGILHMYMDDESKSYRWELGTP